MIASLALSLLAAALAGVAGARDDWTQEALEEVSAAIQVEVGELRNTEFAEPVSVKIADEEGLIRYAVKRMEEMAEPGAMESSEWMAKLLGLLPPEADLEEMTMDLLRGQVGGFYDPGTKSFYLMEGFSGDLARVILAHELTHALDDRLYDLDGALKERIGHSDATIAYMSLVEGSGTELMNRWVMKNIAKLSAEDMREFSKLGTESLESAPPVIWKPMLATYMGGLRFLSIGRRQLRRAEKVRDPNAVLDRAFADPPLSSEQILHPEKYWVPEDRDDPIQVVRATDALPEGWSVAQVDTLGELQLALVTELADGGAHIDFSNPMAMMSIQYTNDAASGWGGDSVALLVRDEAHLLHLVTVWDSEEEAAEFTRTMEIVIENTLAPALKSLAGEGGAHGVQLLPGASPEQRVLTCWAAPSMAEGELDAILEALHWSVPEADEE
jgi:hypothetical protein